jgi:hypothetical protein
LEGEEVVCWTFHHCDERERERERGRRGGRGQKEREVYFGLWFWSKVDRLYLVIFFLLVECQSGAGITG